MTLKFRGLATMLHLLKLFRFFPRTVIKIFCKYQLESIKSVNKNFLRFVITFVITTYKLIDKLTNNNSYIAK